MLEVEAGRRRALLARTSQPVIVCGKALIADHSGALFWPAHSTLLVADLHLEKGSAFARSGTMLPPYDTRHTLARLAEVIGRYQPERIVALGDSFEDADGERRMASADRKVLLKLQRNREWIWITGNHDPALPPRAGGRTCLELSLAGLTLRHQPARRSVTHEIAAHMHPAARLSKYGYSIRRPCFVANGQRVVMPAFGAFTGGLNVLDGAFEPLFGATGIAVWMLGRNGVYGVSPRLLSGD